MLCPSDISVAKKGAYVNESIMENKDLPIFICPDKPLYIEAKTRMTILAYLA